MLKSLIIIAVFLQWASAFSQPTVGEEAPRKPLPDTTFIFEPAEPLRTISDPAIIAKGAWGIDISISESGFGGGAFFNRNLNDDYSLLLQMFITGKRNTDEFEVWDPDVQDWRVRDKVNRLFMIPIMAGVQKYIFRNSLSENFKPYVFLGGGPAIIFSTPYEDNVGRLVDWFTAWSYAKTYFRFGGFGGIGANFGGVGKNSMLGVNLRYYYIPFGGDGLESIRGLPIKNFGGIVLSITIGATY
ncbi:MAG: hypothetical protein ACM3U1_09920 [Chloroflexota bacterium]